MDRIDTTRLTGLFDWHGTQFKWMDLCHSAGTAEFLKLPALQDCKFHPELKYAVTGAAHMSWNRSGEIADCDALFAGLRKLLQEISDQLYAQDADALAEAA